MKMAVLEISLLWGVLVLLASFVSEYIDSTLGMGYGTIMTPVLLLAGFEPLQVVPAVLVSELFSGVLAAFVHQRAGNVRFDFGRDAESRIVKRLGRLGYVPKSNAAKITMVLMVCSIVGSAVAVLIAVQLPSFYLKLYIGALITAMGVLILAKRKKAPRFLWSKIVALGALASFNKGISGGGYGPVVMGGQLLTGVDCKQAVGITSLSEGVTSLVGILVFMLAGTAIDWTLSAALGIGAIASLPLAARSMKRVMASSLLSIIGATTLALGLFTLIKIYF